MDPRLLDGWLLAGSVASMASYNSRCHTHKSLKSNLVQWPAAAISTFRFATQSVNHYSYRIVSYRIYLLYRWREGLRFNGHCRTECWINDDDMPATYGRNSRLQLGVLARFWIIYVLWVSLWVIDFQLENGFQFSSFPSFFLVYPVHWITVKNRIRLVDPVWKHLKKKVCKVSSQTRILGAVRWLSLN